MSTPVEKQPRPPEIHSHHSTVLGAMCVMSFLAALTCWVVSFGVKGEVQIVDGRSTYEAFLDRDFVTWWNWAWLFLGAAVILLVGAILADALNAHSTRLAQLLHQPAAADPEPEATDPEPATDGQSSGGSPEPGAGAGDGTEPK